MIIGVEFDETICDTSFQQGGWLDYLNTISHLYISKEELEAKGVINYDLGSYFTDLSHDEAFAFWKDNSLYQKLKPYPEAVRVINELAERGHDIVFISHCQQNHLKSKVTATKQWFNIPEHQYGFICTKEKRYVNVDVVIDDRNVFLNMFDDHVVKIKINTPFTQCEHLMVELDLWTDDWNKIGDFLDEVIS